MNTQKLNLAISEYIEKKKRCVIVEAEKSVLKRDSIGDCTLIALQGKNISDEQVRIISSLDVKEIIVALDNDVDINEIRFICEKFYRIKNVSYIKDKYKLLGDKDSPCDKGDDVYNYLFKHRINYDSIEHQKLMQSMNKRQERRMKVYFRNSNGKKILIGNAKDNDEAMKVINEFCDERGFKIYYTRMWIDGDNQNRTWIDVGDHLCFFLIEKD